MLRVEPSAVLTLITILGLAPSLTKSQVFRFENDPYTFNISEEASIGDIVGQVSYSGDIGSISFTQVANSQSQGPLPFETNSSGFILVDPQSGSLDFESIAQYDFIIQAKEGLNIVDSASVHVDLLNENDELPLFTVDAITLYFPYMGSRVSEDISSYCIDEDAAPYNEHIFTSTTESIPEFTVSNTGIIRRVQDISSSNYEEVYTFEVRCHEISDQLQGDVLQVTIRALTPNLSPPTFEGETSFSIEETDAPNSVVGTYTVSDADGDNVTLSITGGMFDLFTLNDLGGGIFNLIYSLELDRETRDSLSVEVEAVDGLPAYEWRNMRSTVSTNIEVLDTNDNDPVFGVFQTITITQSHDATEAITTHTCSDQDIGPNAEIRYEILSGDQDHFRVDTNSGAIFLIATSDRSTLLVSNYISLRCYNPNDALSRDDSTIHIQVTASNSHSPRFTHDTELSVEIYETTNPGETIIDVNATDVETIAIVYSFSSLTLDDATDFFNVNDSTGIITLSERIDYETDSLLFVLYIVASDNVGEDSRVATCTATVTILDVNDNAPSFVQPVYTFNLRENNLQEGPPPTDFFTVQCVDPDSLESNLTYYITDVTPIPVGFSFTIRTDNTSKGLLSSTAIIDYDILTTQPRYTINLQCREEKFNGTATLNLHIEPVSEWCPETPLPSSLFVSVDEPVQPGHVFVEFGSSTRSNTITQMVIDNDRDSDFTLQLKNTTFFAVDNEEKTVFTNRQIDLDEPNFETKYASEIEQSTSQFIILVVRVSVCDVAMNENCEQCQDGNFFLAVLRANDKLPSFDAGSYSSNVSESLQAPSTVVDINCTDADVSVGGDLTVAIVGTSNYGNLFDFSATSISLKEGMSLDYESVTQYNFRISCSDSVNTSEALIHITVNGVNEHTPEFSNFYKVNNVVHDNLYRFGVSRTRTQNTAVGVVTVSDEDEGVGGTVMLSLVPSDSTFRISMDGSVILLTDLIMSTSISQYNYTITANDGSRTAEADLILDILDGNYHRPVWVEIPQTVEVRERSAINSKVSTLSCSDDDKPGTVNSQITYSITSGDTDSYFRINGTTGEIQITSIINIPADQEGLDYNLVVQCSDNGDPIMSSTGLLHIIIIDVPIGPIANETLVEATVSENATLNTEVARIELSGEVALLDFSQSLARPFSVTFAQNIILIAVAQTDLLDAEMTQTYEFELYVLETLGRNANFTIIIYVDDINDNAPNCPDETQEYHVDITETAGYEVATLMCDDIDTGLNGRVTYSLTSTHEFFGINEDKLVVLKDLNTILTTNHFLIITARDNGRDNVMSSTLYVQIIIDPINSSPPTFINLPNTTMLDESKPIFSTVYTVRATDPDIGSFGEIFIRKTGGDPNGFFGVNLDGKIRLLKSLYSSTSNTFNLSISAEDAALSVTETLYIIIAEVNDFQPECQQSVFYGSIVEEVVSPTVFTNLVSCSDSDIGLSGSLSYLLENGSHSHLVTIDNDGTVTVSGEIDFEEYDVLTFGVVVSDMGDPPRSTSVAVNINVEAVNEFAPQIRNTDLEASVSENSGSGRSVLQLDIEDNDRSSHRDGQFFTSLEGEGHADFRVLSDGTVESAISLDYERQRSYSLTVVVTDRSITPLSSSTVLTIVVVNQNDVPPFFNLDLYVGNVLTTDTVGFQVIESINCMDNEAIPSVAGILQLESQPSFLGLSGSSIVVTETPPQESSLFTFEVVCYDTDLQPLSSRASISVLLSFGDVEITFEDPNPMTSILESTPVLSGNQPSEVLTVVAIANFAIEYNLTDATDTFIIETHTGIVRLKRALDFETTESYSVTIRATHQLNDTIFSTIQAQINVINENDIKPYFEIENTIVSVDEGISVWDYTILCVDGDKDPYGTVEYSILSGNTPELFTITESSGRLTFLGGMTPDYEVEDQYSLVIECTDGQFAAQSNVIVIILPLNEHPPVFTGSLSASILESISVGTKVATLTAVDEDNLPHGSVRYAITSGNEAVKFSLTASTGELFLIRNVDYENVSSYDLTVIATDDGSVGDFVVQSGSATFTVLITDENDNLPRFSQDLYFERHVRTTPIDSVISIIECTDEDSGINGVQTIELSEPSFTFNIQQDASIATVSLAQSFGTNEDLFILQLTCSDGGADSTTATAVLVVTVESDSQAITFSEPFYQFSLMEDTILQDFGQIVAFDNETNAEITYSLSNVTDNTFIIDSQNGFLSLIRMLDFENAEDRSFTFFVEASTPDNSATVLVSISLNNQNDAAPRLSRTIYLGEVRESQAPLTAVFLHDPFMCTDVDDDASDSASVKYSLAGTSAFAIDQVSGTLNTKVTLDKEVTDPHIFMVICTDSGDLSTTASVQITLLPYNDHSPEFEQSSYMGEIFENILKLNLVTVFANDLDFDTYGNVDYNITGGDPFNFFTIDDGRINVVKKLDYEEQSTYTLTVVASDRVADDDTSGSIMMSDTATVIINVININDEVPVITPSSLAITNISNDAPVTSVVGFFQCTDDDGIGELTFGISLGHQGHFELTDDGYLRTTYSPLLETYSINLQCSDEDFSTEITILVSTNSTNLHPPMFVGLESRVYLEPPDLLTSDCIYMVTVMDSDDSSKPEGIVDFDLTPVDSNEGTFFNISKSSSRTACISPVNGDMIDLGDRQTSLQYGYTITVMDHGEPSHTRSAIIVFVITANSQPEFQGELSTLSVKEGSNFFSAATVLVCVDADTSDTLQLTITDGNAEEAFVISNIQQSFNSEGQLQISGSVDIAEDAVFDYDEGQRVYSLIVTCRDRVAETMTVVTINILPVNEHLPTLQDSYYFDLLENVYVGYNIATFSASDLDAGEDGNLRYTLSFQGIHRMIAARHITLAPSGEFSVIRQLDYDTIPGMKLFAATLTVEDRANSADMDTERMSSTAYVQINIFDVNDVVPHYPEGVNYTFEVDVTENVGFRIGTVQCTDVDGIDDGISYRLINAETTPLFSVDSSTGDITVFDDLINRTSEYYALRILCSDSGVPVLSTSTLVYIRILQVNNYPPVFVSKPDRNQISINESHTLTDTLFMFIATDDDVGLYGQVTYSLLEDFGIFVIDSDSGALNLLRMLDYENGDTQYTVTVVATDGSEDSSDRQSATTTFDVYISDINEFAPACTKQIYTGYFSEDTPVNEEILELQCSDYDGQSLIVTYTVKEWIQGGDQEPFLLNNNKVSYCCSIPRGFALEFYRFVVTVSDGEKTTEIDVVIYFLFGNNFDPQFNQPTFNFTVREDLDIGGEINHLSAMDADQGIQGTVTYSISGEEASFFRINSTGGEVILANMLDRERKNEFSFTVRAQDGDPFTPRNGSASITIFVEDVNDNAPTCNPSYQTIPILSNVARNTVVATLNCDDNDLGENGRVSFAIGRATSGHPFALSETEGEISVSAELEPGTSFLLTVVVSDNGTPSLSTEVDTVIEVYRQNVEMPRLSQSSYIFTINETISVLEEVGQVMATDEDSPSNSLQFSIVESISDFYVDIESGLILVTAPMDFETDNRFEFTIRVQDGGSYNGSDVLQDTALVTINVINENDHQPILSGSGVYGGSVNVTTPPGFTVLRFTCTDIDASPYNDLTVSISPANIPFNLVDLNGGDYEIQVLESLSSVGGVSYTGNISCSDGQFETIGQFFIAIVNPGNPMFTQVVYQWDIPEDAPVGTNYSNILAETNSGTQITYSITQGNEDGIFRLDFDDATLSIVFPLNYENSRRHGLIVRATDGHGNFSEALVFVNVLDVSESSDLAPPSGRYTVPHDSEIGRPFGQLKCSNETIARSDRFNFTFNPPSSIFMVDEYGVLYLSRTLDETPVYVLAVFCYDIYVPDPFVASGIVTIRVLFENKYVPAFDLNPKTVLIDENLEASSLVTTVIARDQDVGSFGEIQYSIESGNEGNKYFINSTNGDISLLSALDYETTNQFNLTIFAVDGGATALEGDRFTGSTTVEVFVQDINDNIPTFSQPLYEEAILTDHEFLAPVLNVSCSDADSGVNMEIEYSISPVSNTFAITNEGTILLTRGLENEDVFTLKVICTDKGMPELSSTAQAVIIVSPVDVDAPVFNESSYTVSIDENHPVLGDFLTVLATPANPTIGVRYSVTGGDGRDTFNVDPDSGSIFTISQLDAVVKAEYYIIVSATNVGPNELSSSVTVIIYIADVNNNQPVFQPSNFYRGSIEENAVITTSILTVSCEDYDLEENAIVSFKASGNAGLFNVSSDGIIYVSSQLDYEMAVEHSFTIICTDAGTPQQSSTANILVRVLPVNEHSPQFSEPGYMFTGVAENTELGTVIGSVEASDNDTDIHGQFLFRLSGNGLYASFLVNARDGSITVARPLDYETEPVHTLSVEVEDEGGESSAVQVTILLDDVNDNDPTLVPTAGSVLIHVTEPVDSTLQRFTCDDVDTIPATSPVLSIINDTSNNNFGIDDVNNLVLKKKFDNPGIYLVKLSCEDGEGRRAEPTAAVAITVYEDRALIPNFSEDIYQVYVNEGTYEDREILTVVAEQQAGHPISYFLNAGSPPLVVTVDSSGGVVRLTGTLNRAVKSVHHIVARATASGHSSLAVIVINVVDINDNIPMLDPPQLSLSILETLPSPVALATVLCTDDDIGSNGETTVSIAGGGGAGVFSISTEGVFSLVGEVDYDSGQRVYSVPIECRDNGLVPNYVNGSILVTLLPVNEYPPVFTPDHYSASLSEMAAYMNFLQLNISDKDGGEDGMFSIEFSSGIGVTDFEINSKLLSAGGSLNATRQDYYNLEVSATDQGSPVSYTAFAAVIINVTDINEQPHFTESIYTVYASEDAENGSFVTDVLCWDSDIGINSQVNIELVDDLNFKLAIISNQQGITIGRLFTNNYPLSLNGYTLTLTCTDGGEEPLSTTATMLVNVVKKNFEPPFFYNLPGSVSVKENTVAPVTLFTVSADDAESGILVTYELVGGNSENIFTLNPTNGQIILTRSVDFEVTQSYALVVQASDGSPVNPMYTNATLYVAIDNVNDVLPVLEGTSAINLEENYRVGDIFTQYTCTDADGFPISISLDQESQSQFNVFADGQIALRRSLDFEIAQQHLVDVTCRDDPPDIAGNPQVAVKQLIVSILAVNEFAPEFVNPSSFIFNIRENTIVDTPVLLGVVKAIDRDNRTGAEIRYRFVNLEEETFLPFIIDELSGEVFLVSFVDREAISQYNLTVEADDGDMIAGPRSSSVDIVIDITDVNDNRPSCEKNIFVHQIVEGNNVEEIAVLNCSDADIGVNGRLNYTILSEEITGGINFTFNNAMGSIHMQGLVLPGVIDLSVLVSDNGSPPLTVNIQVILNILSKDPNALVFQPFQYFVTVREDIEDFSIIFPGNDFMWHNGTNTTPTYSHVSSDPEIANTFVVIQNGDIELTSVLDYESREEYAISLKADQGSNYTAFVILVVTVEDVNDNRPEFTQPSYSASIDEEVANEFVIQVSATDKDRLPFGSVVSYELIGPFSRFFAVHNETGIITTQVGIDYEEHPVINLQIQAVDNGNPSLFALTTVDISIINLNDNPPVFNKTEHVVYITSGEQVPSVLLKFDVTDADMLDDLIFNVNPASCADSSLPLISTVAEYFAVEASTQSLRLIRLPPQTGPTHYYFQVRASDGESIGVACVNVFIRTVTELVYQINETDTVNAFSYDLYENVKTKLAITANAAFLIIGGNKDDIFAFDRDLPVLRNVKPIDRESNPQFRLFIEVSDEGINATILLNILVADVNDNAPVFIGEPYIFFVQETQSFYTFTTDSIAATDPDLGFNGLVYYELKSNISYDGFFIGIDRDTAILQVTGTFDRELFPQIVLKVTASDLGSTRQSTDIEVVIHIVDINDNAPIFNPDVVSRASILPGSRANTTVTLLDENNLPIRLTVSDRDENLNAEINVTVEMNSVVTIVRVVATPIEAKKRTVNGPVTYVIELFALVTIEDMYDQTKLTLVATNGKFTKKLSFTLFVQNTPPAFSSEVFTTEIRSGELEGKEVMILVATDPDPHIVTYKKGFLGVNEPFSVADDGKVTSFTRIEDIWPKKFLFEVIAEDNNDPIKGTTLAYVAIDVFDSSHILIILSSCDPIHINNNNQEIRMDLEKWFAENGHPGSLFMYEVTDPQSSDREEVKSRILLYIVLGTFHQNNTSPDITTLNSAQTYVKSFYIGEDLFNTISNSGGSNLLERSCYLEADYIRDGPVTSVVSPPSVSPTLIAVIVVVCFLAFSLCVMVACICCYCYYARLDKKEADKDYMLYHHLAPATQGEGLDLDFVPADPHLHLLYQQEPTDREETSFGNFGYDQPPVDTFDDDSHLMHGAETEDSSIAEIESDQKYNMGPFLREVLTKFEESEKTLVKDKQRGRRK